MIKFILCTDKHGALGYKGDLIYHISNDLVRFKKLTQKCITLSGRKTQESLPNQFLPNRTNVVITRDKKYKPANSGVIVVHDLEKAVEQYQDGNKDKDLIVIGGSELYSNFPVYPHVIHHTKVLDIADKFDVEVGMDELLGVHYSIDSPKYTEYKVETHLDPKSGLMYQFIDYVKTDFLEEYHKLQLMEDSNNVDDQ